MKKRKRKCDGDETKFKFTWKMDEEELWIINEEFCSENSDNLSNDYYDRKRRKHSQTKTEMSTLSLN
jgi:hypothetical protein